MIQDKDPLVPVIRLGKWPLALLLLAPLLVILPVLLAQRPVSVQANAELSESTPNNLTGALVMSSAQCLQCHAVDPIFSHPVRVTPSMQVPDSMPLENKQIACTTCHLDSVSDHAAMRSAKNKTPLLRLPAQTLCITCHTEEKLTAHGMHPRATERAHLKWPGQRLATTSTNNREDGSRTCLECHDGTVASAVENPSSSGGMGDSLGAHPYSIAYQKTGKSAHDLTLKPISNLDLRIRLFNGQVGCQSCHSPYSSLPKHLVISTASSKLCISCHEIN